MGGFFSWNLRTSWILLLSAGAGFGGRSSAFEATKSLMVLVIRRFGYLARRFTQLFNQFSLATRSRRSLKLWEKTAYCKPTVCSLPISLDLRYAGYLGYTLRHLGCVQTDRQQLPGVVACVLAVVCKRKQQVPAMLWPTVHRGKDTAHKSL